MPTLETLQKALAIAEKIEALQTQLDAIVAGSSPKEAPKKRGPNKGTKRGPKKGSKRVLSPEAIEKIREAQRKRWSKQKK